MLKVLWLVAALAADPQGYEGPGWYTVELSVQNVLTARLIAEDGNFYLFDFQGTTLRIEKTNVRRLKRLSPELGAAGGAMREREEAMRDAVESLSSADEAVADGAYSLLSSDIALGRPFLHFALRQQSSTVRLLAVKILGEKGNAAEDLAQVAGRLADEHGSVRLAAVMATRVLGSEGLPQLVRYLAEEPVANNRKMAVKTLRLWQDARAVEPLVGHLSREKDQNVVNFVVAALEVLTRQKLGRDPDAWVNYLAAQQSQKDTEKMAAAAAGLSGSAPRVKE